MTSKKLTAHIVAALLNTVAVALFAYTGHWIWATCWTVWLTASQVFWTWLACSASETLSELTSKYVDVVGKHNALAKELVNKQSDADFEAFAKIRRQMPLSPPESQN